MENLEWWQFVTCQLLQLISFGWAKRIVAYAERNDVSVNVQLCVSGYLLKSFREVSH